MSLLDQKLVRTCAMRGQVITIALMVAAGVAVFVASISTLDLLQSGRDRFYAAARFPAGVRDTEAGPLSIVSQLNEIPGIAAVEPRIVRDVIVDWPSSMLPVSARMVSLTRAGDEPLARLHLRRGIAPQPGRHTWRCDQRGICRGECSGAGSGRSRCTQRPFSELPHHRHRSIARICLRGETGLPIPDDRFFAVLWIDRIAAEAAFDMKGAFNDAVVSLTPGTDPKPVIAELDRLLEPYGSVGRHRTARSAFQQVSRGRAQPAEGHVHDDSLHFLRRRGISAQCGARQTGGGAARTDRRPEGAWLSHCAARAALPQAGRGDRASWVWRSASRAVLPSVTR